MWTIRRNIWRDRALKNKILNAIRQEQTLLHLMILFFICALVGVYTFTGRSDLARLSAEMNDTADYVNGEYLMSQKFNHVNIMQGLDRLVDKTRHVQGDIRAGKTIDDAYLESMTERLRLTGILVLDKDGEVLGSHQKSGQVPLALLNHLSNKVILEVGKYPLKIYTDRLHLDDGSFIDFAAGGYLGTDKVIVTYYHTDAVYADGYDLDLQRIISGFHTHMGSHVVITKENKIIAVNDKTIADAESKYGEIIEAIKAAHGNHKKSDEPLAFRAGGVNYYGFMTNGRNYYVYQFVPEDRVFSSRNSNTAYSALAGVIFIILILWARQRANQKASRREEQREAEYQTNLLEKAQEAEMANMAKTEFLRRMSHDIRTPINGIRGMVEIAGHYKDDLEKQGEYRRKVWEASGYLLELVNEVLEISKLESGKIVLENKPFNLRNMLQDVEVIVEKQAEGRGLTLSFTNDCQNDRFIGSPLYVKRTLMNIIGNAIKYNRDGGSVTVEAREETISDTMSRITVTCKDTGIGMSEDFQKRMFEPFSQEVSDARTSYNGTGLGLAIAKKVVEQMDGTITCESTYGEGTTFTVTLPLTIDKSEEITESTTNEIDIRGTKILLAEDNELNMEIAEFLLVQAGAEVVKAMNGEEAVDTFKKSKEGEFDAILMDVMMPLMDGLEATRAIRALDRSDAQTVPIIAMTANAFAEDRQNVMEAGMNEHLTKPLDSALVIATVAKFVKK